MESKNYKFNLDPPRLSRGKIESHMDFDALLDRFESEQNTEGSPTVKTRHKTLVRKLNTGKKLRFMSVATAIAAAFAGVFFYFSFIQNNNSLSKEEIAYWNSKEFINPPFDNVKPVFTSHKLKADKGGKFNLKKNKRNKVVVPQKAFVTAKGNEVEGDVDIFFIEHHDFIDIFISGIPMHYDSAAYRLQLESAGMLEIYAEQNGERLNVSPGKTLTLEVVADVYLEDENDLGNFNIYSIDKEGRNWKYEGLGDVSIIKKLSDEKSELKQQFEARMKDLERTRNRKLKEIEEQFALPQTPQEPKRRNNNTQSFSLTFEDLEFTKDVADEDIEEMKSLSLTTWQSVEGTTLPDDFGVVEWDKYQVQKLGENLFEFTLTNGDRKESFKANPILSGEKLERARNEYKEKLAVYLDEVEVIKNKIVIAQEPVSSRFNKDVNSLKASFNEQITALTKDGKNKGLARYRVKSKFEVDHLGIWNCGRTLRIDKSKLKASFIDNNNIKYNLNTAFIVNKTKNTLNQHYTEDGSKLPVIINRNEDKLLMWLVTEDDKIAVFGPQQFRQIEKDKGDYTFEMNIIDKKIESENDVREILGKNL